MKWVNNVKRWSVRGLHAMILGAAVAGPGSFAAAQSTGAISAKLPDRCFTRNRSFFLPVNMTPEQQAKIAAIHLYGKTPTTDWKLQQTGEPSITRFSCRVSEDGEYWYSLVTIDREGRPSPGDVNLAPPMLRVVVDNLPPALQVKGHHGPDGEFLVHCTIEDTNPDYATLKAVCKTDHGDVALEAVVNQPGTFRLKAGLPLHTPVVVTAMDQAKNITVRELKIAELSVATIANAAATLAKDIAPASVRPELKVALPEDPPALSRTDLPRTDLPRTDLPRTDLPRTDLPPKLETPPKEFGPAAKAMPKVEVPRKDPTPRADGAVLPGLPNRIELPIPPVLGPSPVKTASAEITTPTAPTTPTPQPTQERGTVPYQLINETHASVEYRIDQVGLSGVGKVEIYMTPDKGQTWHRLGEDHDKRSPADINLPGDGVFGIRIAISNGNGFGGRAPSRGDAPHCEIEVDTTSPFVQLRSTEVLPSSGHVEIRWNATDKNLGPTPVNLYYRTGADGPWQLVARDLKNDGVHRWAFPRENSANLFFKIQVTDQAGNVSYDVTRQPVAIDMTEPRATVVGVTGSGGVRPASGSH